MIKKIDPIQKYTITRLDDHHYQEALDILTDAFQEDPMIKHMFPQNTKAESEVFFHYLLTKATLLNEQLLGVTCDGVLAGVANLETPKGDNPTLFQIGAFIYQSLRLIFKISWRNFIFINSYMKYTSSLRPRQSHHYLIFIGVSRNYQGMGFGRKLLAHIHQLVEQLPDSFGIGLDTENRANISLYERFGYKLVGEEHIESVTIYSMFKSK